MESLEDHEGLGCKQRNIDRLLVQSTSQAPRVLTCVHRFFYHARKPWRARSITRSFVHQIAHDDAVQARPTFVLRWIREAKLMRPRREADERGRHLKRPRCVLRRRATRVMTTDFEDRNMVRTRADLDVYIRTLNEEPGPRMHKRKRRA